MKMVAVLHRFSIVYLLCLFPSQNKCTRYWPDPDTTKDISTFHVRYLKEFEYSDYTLREFELTSETNVSVAFTIVYFIVCLFFSIVVPIIVLKIDQQNCIENVPEVRHVLTTVERYMFFLSLIAHLSCELYFSSSQKHSSLHRTAPGLQHWCSSSPMIITLL